MHEIIRGLYLGGLSDAVNIELLRLSGVHAIVNCCTTHEFPVIYRYAELEYFVIDVEDIGAENIAHFFSESANFIDYYVARKQGVLVHCKSGVSRSATIAIAYLVIKKNFFLQQAFFHVRSKRDIICPNIGFMLQLCNLERQLSNGTFKYISSTMNHVSKSPNEADLLNKSRSIDSVSFTNHYPSDCCSVDVLSLSEEHSTTLLDKSIFLMKRPLLNHKPFRGQTFIIIDHFLEVKDDVSSLDITGQIASLFLKNPQNISLKCISKDDVSTQTILTFQSAQTTRLHFHSISDSKKQLKTFHFPQHTHLNYHSNYTASLNDLHIQHQLFKVYTYPNSSKLSRLLFLSKHTHSLPSYISDVSLFTPLLTDSFINNSESIINYILPLQQVTSPFIHNCVYMIPFQTPITSSIFFQRPDVCLIPETSSIHHHCSAVLPQTTSEQRDQQSSLIYQSSLSLANNLQLYKTRHQDYIIEGLSQYRPSSSSSSYKEKNNFLKTIYQHLYHDSSPIESDRHRPNHQTNTQSCCHIQSNVSNLMIPTICIHKYIDWYSCDTSCRPAVPDLDPS